MLQYRKDELKKAYKAQAFEEILPRILAILKLSNPNWFMDTQASIQQDFVTAMNGLAREGEEEEFIDLISEMQSGIMSKADVIVNDILTNVSAEVDELDSQI